jgi:hypothetical protein
MSFSECSARPIRPTSSASSISLANPLAADLGEQAMLHSVAGRSDGHDLDRSRRGKLGMCRDQAIANDGGLAPRHRAAAGADAERTGGQGAFSSLPAITFPAGPARFAS